MRFARKNYFLLCKYSRSTHLKLDANKTRAIKNHAISQLKNIRNSVLLECENYADIFYDFLQIHSKINNIDLDYVNKEDCSLLNELIDGYNNIVDCDSILKISKVILNNVISNSIFSKVSKGNKIFISKITAIEIYLVKKYSIKKAFIHLQGEMSLIFKKKTF